MNAFAIPTAGPAPSPELLAAIGQRALALQQAAAHGEPPPSLHGRFLGLVCEHDDTPEAALFRRAATGLGARVARVKPGLDGNSSPAEVAQTARMLGKLYDALEFQGIDSRLVAQIGQAAGVPVFDGLAADGHPTAALMLGSPASAASADTRLHLLQAALLTALA